MLIEIIKNKIENKRNSSSFFWKIAIVIKDLLWFLVHIFLEIKKRAKNKKIRRKLFNGAYLEKNVVLPPLLSKDKFVKVFEELKGKNVGLVRMPGNIGDRLIDESAMQLLKKFGINFCIINKNPRLETFSNRKCLLVDEFVVSGGGNMGEFYKDAHSIRQMIFNYGKPVSVFPQTFVHSEEKLPYKSIWVREIESLKYSKNAKLAPDLVLGYEYRGVLPKPKYKVGVWLRGDFEALGVSNLESLGDPEPICSNTKEYIQLAALYEKIITDRLHFAVCGLLAKRKVVLLPNNYFKNRALFDTWLKDLGCEWGSF